MMPVNSKNGLPKHDSKEIGLILQSSAFADLPEHELELLSQNMNLKQVAKGTFLYKQGDPVEQVVIVDKGHLELYFYNQGKKTLKQILKRGEIFGAISILMNDGMALRSIKAKEDVYVYEIDKEVFKEVCNRNYGFADHFTQIFDNQMQDKFYASTVVAQQVFNFLSNIIPFSFLPEDELLDLAKKVSLETFVKDTILFYQEKSKVENLYVIRNGYAERYFEQDGKKTLRGMLGEGDNYGGISILINSGVSVRTIKVMAGTCFYVLHKSIFLDLCDKYDAFTEYFTDTFGKRMINRTYASIIRKSYSSQNEDTAFFNQHVRSLYQSKLLFCDQDTSIQEAALQMSQKNCSSILVKEQDGRFIGLMTDHDLRSKVVAQGYDIHKPVASIMSKPLQTISIDAMVSEALLKMIDINTKHLAVTDAKENVIGVITNRDMLAAQGQSPFFIVREVSLASSLDEIFSMQHRLPGVVRMMINSGAKSRVVTRLISAISDAILKKLIGFAIDQLGTPPVDFAFLVMGSEGRVEQTLKTDQDNAIIFEDVKDSDLKKVTAYFTKLGNTVCDWLDQAGYTYCKGNVMAKNPKWCQPIGKWKEYFYSWIRISTNEDLLQSAIFFDFRGAYGNMDMVDNLRLYLFENLSGWSRFFRDLTVNALNFKPPIGFFRNFLVESKGSHRNKFDIKSAMVPVVDFGRIYALHHNIAETNTQERIYRLYLDKVLTQELYDDLNQAYNYLMQQRLVCQIQDIENNIKPDNYVNPKNLSRIEQTILKEIFKRIEGWQTRLKLDFTGGA